MDCDEPGYGKVILKNGLVVFETGWNSNGNNNTVPSIIVKFMKSIRWTCREYTARAALCSSERIFESEHGAYKGVDWLEVTNNSLRYLTYGHLYPQNSR